MFEPWPVTETQEAYDELRCYTLTHRDPTFIHQEERGAACQCGGANLQCPFASRQR